MAPQQMSVALLRKALKARGIAASGNKAALVAELTAALAAEAARAAAQTAEGSSPGMPRFSCIRDSREVCEFGG